tara:strand:+ start:335 stop:1255 length:921 start_codon:yes stop_codon:yes gene_type:complete
MKKILLNIIISASFGFSQGDIYPTETQYGGGIGFSTMYMVLDSVPGATILDSLGFSVNRMGTRPLVFYGGEGFAQMTGPWRLGGYAGIGAAQTSNVYNIHLYANRDKKVGFQQPALGNESKGDTLYAYSDKLSVKARINFLMGAMTIEYVFPVYRDLEVMAGALMGVGRYTLSVDQHIETPQWSKFSTNMYGYLTGDSILVELDTLGGATRADLEDTADRYRINDLRPINVNGTMTELSGTFFNFQPYVAVKWQFLDRMGLRISAGYNKGTIGAGKWKLNGHVPVNDSPESALGGFTIRTVVYFGL